VRELERRVRAYFALLRLPDEATLYDRLILALQPNDIIATFNWDPLLYHAYRRNSDISRLPEIVALHGSVALGACGKHGAYGFGWASCGVCNSPFVPLPLLYPIRQKNYYQYGFIASQWDLLRQFMKHAVCLSVFGYGAPVTDVEAVRLLGEMAAKNAQRGWAHVEIIDIKTASELRTKWAPFFVADHYSIVNHFRHSILAQYPRRSREMVFRRHVFLNPPARLRGRITPRFQESRPFPETDDLSVLQQFARQLIGREPKPKRRLTLV
jgi:hypothetical protein